MFVVCLCTRWDHYITCFQSWGDDSDPDTHFQAGAQMLVILSDAFSVSSDILSVCSVNAAVSIQISDLHISDCLKE